MQTFDWLPTSHDNPSQNPDDSWSVWRSWIFQTFLFQIPKMPFKIHGNIANICSHSGFTMFHSHFIHLIRCLIILVNLRPLGRSYWQKHGKTRSWAWLPDPCHGGFCQLQPWTLISCQRDRAQRQEFRHRGRGEGLIEGCFNTPNWNTPKPVPTGQKGISFIVG